LEWVKIFDQHTYDSAKAVAIDSLGNVYTVGDCEATDSDYDILLLKYDDIGNLLWAKEWNHSSHDSGFDITIDSSNHIYVVGNTFENSITACIVKFDENGNELWNHTWGNGVQHRAWGVATDSQSNVYMTGNELEGINPLGELICNAFIVKYNSSGSFEWAKNISQSLSSDIVLDTEDNIYVVGSYHGYQHNILLKFDHDGKSLKNVTWQGEGDITIKEIALDSFGNLYVAGTNLTISEGNIEEAMTLIKYNNECNFQWAQRWANSTTEMNTGRGVGIDSANNIFLLGRTGNFSNLDVILLQYNSTGSFKGSRQWDKGPLDSGYGIAIENLSDNIYITGEISDSAFLLKYNNSMGSPDSIQGYVVNKESTKSSNDSQSDNKSVNSINGYNIAVFLISIMFILVIGVRKKCKPNV